MCFKAGNGNLYVSSISHFTYADDTLILCQADENQLMHLKLILVVLGALSRLNINFAKSNIFAVNKVQRCKGWLRRQAVGSIFC